MELCKEEKPPARQDWSPDELLRLYNKVKAIANKTKRVTSWDKFIRDYFPWDEIEMKNRSKDEIKAVLMELLDKRHVRHYRLLNELMDDLAEKAENTLPPFIPDPPKKPPPTYMLYSISIQKKIRQENPHLDMGAIGKIVGESYQRMPEKKKNKLGAQHQQLMDKYHQECEEYLTKYPQMAPLLRGEGKQKQSFAPPKQPTNMYTLICQDVRTKMKEELGRDVTFKEAQQRVGKNYQNSLSPEEKSHYEEIYKESMKKYEQELAEFREKHPEIAVEMDTKKKPVKKEAKQEEVSVEKEVVASESEDSDFAQPKSKKSKSTVTLSKQSQDVVETNSKKKKLKPSRSEDEERLTNKKQTGEEKMNGKVSKRKETKSESNDSEDEEPEIKPVKQTKRKVPEKKDIDSSDSHSEVLHKGTGATKKTKKKQSKHLITSSKVDDSDSDTEPMPKKEAEVPTKSISLSRKLCLEPPMLSSNDETDEETNVVEYSAPKTGKIIQMNKAVKLRSKNSSESENEVAEIAESPKKEFSRKKSESDDSDDTTPSPPAVKSKKIVRDNLGGKVQKIQKSYLTLNEMKRLDYNELTKALKKSLPGYPVQGSLGALDVFMEIYPTRDLSKARKKFQRLEIKEREEIFSMYRQEKDDFRKRMKQFYAGLDQEERRFFKLVLPIIREKMNTILSEHSVEGQSEEDD